MNFNWRKVNEDDYTVLDEWTSEDIKKYITFGNEFVISEYVEMFSYISDRNAYVAIDDNEEIVGVLLYDHKVYDPKIKDSGINIQVLVVNPELLRRGIATKMLEDVIAENKEEYSVFRVHVEKENIPCVKLLTKLGFAIEGKNKKKSKCCIYKLDTRELNKNRK